MKLTRAWSLLIRRTLLTTWGHIRFRGRRFYLCTNAQENRVWISENPFAE